MAFMRRSTVQNSAVMDSPAVNVSCNDTETAYSVHGGILFTQAAIVLLAGLLLPIPPIAIDILLAVNLVFTAMLLFVVLFAREPAEITAVPLVVIFVTLLRLGTNVAAAKSILLIANGGHIIDWCGTRIYYGFISIVIAVLLVFVICVLICKAATFIRHKAISYLIETIPNRQATLETEFHAGTITNDQMLRAKNRIEKQIKFFAGMASTSSLLLCDGVIALIITLATICGATAIGVMNAATLMNGSQQYSPLAMAIALTTSVPAAMVALALRLLVNKRFLIMLKVQSPMAQAIHVASQVKDPADDELDALDLPDAAQNDVIDTEFTDSTQEEFSRTEAVEPLPQETAPLLAAESAVVIPPAPQHAEPEAIEEMADLSQTVRNDYYYDSILATIGDKSKATILLAGQSAAHLPVTIAVELVIHIIQLRKKCLLIDMDSSRNAVATAFDIDGATMQGKAVPTGIENLWISPADDAENSAAIKLSRKVASALKVFHYVVIYAPNAAVETVQDQLAGAADVTVIFGMENETPPLEQLVKKLALWGCRTVFEKDLLKKNT
ncbi:MAG: FHIPEP family type III secretion protein [Sedimentisphaerales bacterium]|nr:FHIPEP family type III secretion protein [Sedimentisphaerales bacterium]